MEKRIVASLVLMFGLTALALGIHLNQLTMVIDIVKSVCEACRAGLP